MERIWQRATPGVPTDIQLDGVSTMVTVVRDSCRQYAGKTSYISMGKSISYAELDALTRDFAAWLHANGLGKGDRIALMMPNLLQYPVCLFGAWRAGCVVVNCNPLYTAHELEHQLADSGARAIVVADNFAATLQQALPRAPSSACWSPPSANCWARSRAGWSTWWSSASSAWCRPGRFPARSGWARRCAPAAPCPSPRSS